MSCGAPHHESQGQLRDSVGDGLWMMRRVGLDGELEDDEFGRAEWGDADGGDETAVVQVVLGHGGVVTTDQEGLLRRGALEGAELPQL